LVSAGIVKNYHDNEFLDSLLWCRDVYSAIYVIAVFNVREFDASTIATGAAAIALLSADVGPARTEPARNAVIVHLGKDGWALSVAQVPLRSLADDVAATKRVLDSLRAAS
jgi:hypothetical protein